jgi:hypothetical protein
MEQGFLWLISYNVTLKTASQLLLKILSAVSRLTSHFEIFCFDGKVVLNQNLIVLLWRFQEDRRDGQRTQGKGQMGSKGCLELVV